MATFHRRYLITLDKEARFAPLKGVGRTPPPLPRCSHRLEVEGVTIVQNQFLSSS